ncbi:MAG: bifunctional folylpolyglutamate synthase/dihydrofolate synthase [Muribaculaceae bacterium]|nr:bifunctional folylpolyglutamate synthase/dihydrofolate synthase [Muribaculaceae bacterium]MDE6523579.1 bifunctional folylpolyglutamate synthase/dihydrofolate synthase [Muribaculaceae bacterium]
MDYQQTLDWLFAQLPMFSRTGAAAYKPGLQTSHDLDKYFNHPHKRFKSIHVGGTNGKGSTSHIIAAILQSQGYRTGLYTSPHLVDFRERIRVNGEMITKDAVIDFVNKFRKSNYEGHPSFFELTMMMAFDYFASEKVDYAVIEVGMGGRLDSTNIITPELAVITNISKDHTQFLGKTLVEIAGEKAGIIKEGVPCVVGEAEGEIREVFEEKASATGTTILFADSLHPLQRCEPALDGGLNCSSPICGDFHCQLGGDYQKKNINTVLTALYEMRRIGIAIDDDAIHKGMNEVCELTGLAGRWMKVSDRPLTICDTGHNEAGIRFTMSQLERKANECGGKKHIVIGFVADKAIDDIIVLLPKDAIYYLTCASIPRALPAADLKTKFNEHGIEGNVYANPKEAVEAARSNASPDDIIYIGGSTFIVADFLS